MSTFLIITGTTIGVAAIAALGLWVALQVVYFKASEAFDEW